MMSAPRGDARTTELLAWLRDWAPRRLRSRLHDERRCIAPHVVLELGRRGVFGMNVPASHGGAPLPVAGALRVIEQLAAIDLTLATFVGINNALGVRPLAVHGSAAVRDRFLPELAAGRMLAGLALTEPGAGSNPQALVARGVPCGPGRWQLHGDKQWIGMGAWAGVLNVFVRLARDEQPGGEFCGFVVPEQAPGLVQGEESPTMGMRAVVQNAVHLRGVEVAASQRLGAPGGGVAVVKDILGFGRLGIAAISLGGLARCVQLATRYAGRRTIATGRLLDHPLSRERIAHMLAAHGLIRSLVARVAAALDAGEPVAEDWLIACKVLGPELLWRAVDDTMQLLGGRGYVETNTVSQLLRDARLLRIFEGPTEALTGHLGSKALLDRRAVVALLGTAARGRIELAIARVREQLGRESDIASRRERGHHAAAALGELVCFALAAEAVGDEPGAGGLAEEGMAAAERRIARILEARPPAADALRAQVAAVTAPLGALASAEVGEEQRMDALLVPD